MDMNELFGVGFSEQSRESEHEKLIKKQRIGRGDFRSVGKYELPFIKKQDIDLDKIELWNFTKTKPNDTENKHKTIHFFTYDWLFETVYAKATIKCFTCLFL